jgi:hypothetical protein
MQKRTFYFGNTVEDTIEFDEDQFDYIRDCSEAFDIELTEVISTALWERNMFVAAQELGIRDEGIPYVLPTMKALQQFYDVEPWI